MARMTDRSAPFGLGPDVSALLTANDPPDLARRSMAERTGTGRRISQNGHAESHDRRSAPVGSTVVGFLAGPGELFGTLAIRVSKLEPLPCRLSTQELVELLKMPTCIGPARRVVLDQLQNRYRQQFADHWAFVRFAQEQNLGLDFTSPPKRPVATAGGEKK